MDAQYPDDPTKSKSDSNQVKYLYQKKYKMKNIIVQQNVFETKREGKT